jgi:hypothetical protein
MAAMLAHAAGARGGHGQGKQRAGASASACATSARRGRGQSNRAARIHVYGMAGDYSHQDGAGAGMVWTPAPCHQNATTALQRILDKACPGNYLCP